MYFRKLSLKTKITGMVLLLFLCSIWLLTFFISRRLEQEMTKQIEAQQFSIASYIAISIENQVKLRISSLNAIAAIITPELIANPGKLREFLRVRPLLLTLFQTGVAVLSKEGRVIADYPVLPGRSGGSLSDREYFRDVVATGKPAVGKPMIGRFSSKPVIGFAVPILNRSGQLMGVLAGYTLLSDPTLLGTIETALYKGFSDRFLVASPKYRIYVTGSDPTRIMKPTPAPGVNPLFDRFMAGFEGSGVTVNSRGIRILLSAKQIPTPRWFSRVGLPTDMAFAPIRSMKHWAYSITLGLSILSSLLVWLVIRQALRPLYAASRLIQDITEERLPLQNIPITQYDEVGQLLASFNVHLDYRKQAEEQIKHSLKEKETLLKEIHHRVKNNLAIVSSLLALQSKQIKDKTLRAMFDDSQQRIRAMALVHEKLYQTTNFSQIDFGDYINTIVKELLSTFNIEVKDITTRMDIADIKLDLEYAIPCGLMINELLTNSFKYAFPGDRGGEIAISFTKSNDIFTLTIKDNGIGLPEGFEYKQTSTLGLQIVNVLANQLWGTLQMNSNGGTEAVIAFRVRGDRDGKEENTDS